MVLFFFFFDRGVRWLIPGCQLGWVWIESVLLYGIVLYRMGCSYFTVLTDACEI